MNLQLDRPSTKNQPSTGATLLNIEQYILNNI